MSKWCDSEYWTVACCWVENSSMDEMATGYGSVSAAVCLWESHQLVAALSLLRYASHCFPAWILCTPFVANCRSECYLLINRSRGSLYTSMSPTTPSLPESYGVSLHSFMPMSTAGYVVCHEGLASGNDSFGPPELNADCTSCMQRIDQSVLIALTDISPPDNLTFPHCCSRHAISDNGWWIYTLVSAK